MLAPPHEIQGNYGMIVMILRQSWHLRNCANQRERDWHRSDIRACVTGLRHNRALETAALTKGPNQ